MESIDDVDRKIIRELTQNARLSYREIGKKLGISVATVANRISKLEKEGVIKGYTAVINTERIGFTITAVIKLVIKEGKLLEVQRELAKEKNVIAIYDVTGEVDSIIIARFIDRQDMSRFVKRVLKMPYVDRTHTHVVLEVVKEDPVSIFREE
ncbi:MAG: Lrp/AsnC family transcriptional regulator [Aigarchaeota archaeon]|nr:Lrp/AsnC family transcriptional regulator [Aigarchaeota archaeon]MDW8092181.1 Lrp/AsnC family transcriptional regulator [Nitrososphaerota archaeon]